MKDGMTIIDAAGHVLDWEPIYRERLPEAVKQLEKIITRKGYLVSRCFSLGLSVQ